MQPVPVEPSPSGVASAPLLRTLVLADLVESTALTERLGDQRALEIFRKHDRIGRDLAARHGGQEIDKTDGFLLMFDRPIRAIAFALDYQRALKQLGEELKVPLSARVGIHVGDVLVWENSAEDIAHGAKPIEVEGLVKPIAARLMSVAIPRQTLLSGVANALAQRGVGELGERAASVRFKSHGPYRFKGVADPMPIFEVGEPDVAPLKRPPSAEKAWRVVPWWRRPRAIAVELVVLAAAIGVPLWLATQSQPALAFAARDFVVVADLQNLTEQPVFDRSLDSALRIGLEQSRYVNVVPDVQVRAALARMKRDPSTTRIDRTLGAELAQREGAKAVLVPSISSYGKSLKLALELVEPGAARSVAVETVEASGPQDVLPAADKLLRQMRGRLGESLAQIDASALPLEKVTTANMDALKAFSGAEQALSRHDFDQALSLLRYATELDGEFAMAYARWGAVLYSLGRTAEALPELDRAVEIKGRLSEREQLYVRAQRARFDDPATVIDSWRRYAGMYPDIGTGQNNLGNLHFILFNDLRRAHQAYDEAIATKNPLKSFSMVARGFVTLAQGDAEKALADFDLAQAQGSGPVYFSRADALEALGRHSDAEAYLTSAPKNTPTLEPERALRRATIAADRGDFALARRIGEQALADASKLPTPAPARRAAIAAAAAAAAAGATRDAIKVYSAEVARLDPIVANGSAADLTAPEAWLYDALMLARLGETSTARRVAKTAAADAALKRFPIRVQLLRALDAELALPKPDADTKAALAAVAGSEEALFEVHESLARLYRAAADRASERAELEWLAAHRGLAFGEWIDMFLGQAGRVVEWNRARLRLAELASEDGRKEEAAKLAQAFLDQWPSAEESADIKRARALAADAARAPAGH